MAKVRIEAVNGKLLSVQFAGTDQATDVIARTPTSDWPLGYDWETFDEEPQPDGSLALKCMGRYLSAQPNGRVEGNRTEVGAWEKFLVTRDGQRVQYQSQAHGTILYADVNQYREAVDPETGVVLWSGFLIGMRNPDEFIFTRRPLQGDHPFALQGRLYAKGGIWYDATGPVLPQFFHCMPLVRVFNDNTEKFQAALQAGVDAGRHGIRFGYNLVESEDQDNGYWRGCHVPLDMGMELSVPVHEALANAGLKSHIFGANNFGGDWSKERAWLQQLLTRIADAGYAETVGLFSWRNEPFMTSPYGGHSQDTYTHGAEAMAMAREILGCAVSMGAMGEDDGYITGTITNGKWMTNDGVYAPSVPSGFYEGAGIDFSRGHPGEVMVKRLDRAYYDGRYHGKYQGGALWNIEPTGMNDAVPPGCVGDVYYPLDDPAFLFTYHLRGALDGMACSFFNGPSVRYAYPIDTGYGFHELPAFIRDWIPPDIGLWTGPTFMIRGNEFVTVLCEAWGYIGDPSHPLKSIEGRAVESWRALFYDGAVISGSGPIGLVPGWKGACLRGTLTGPTTFGVTPSLHADRQYGPETHHYQGSDHLLAGRRRR
jgi:hypothetical protein